MFKHAVEPLHVRRCGPVLPFFLKKINNLPQGSFCVSVSWIQINYLAIINNPRYGVLAFSLMMEWKVCYLLLDLHCFFFSFAFGCKSSYIHTQEAWTYIIITIMMQVVASLLHPLQRVHAWCRTFFFISLAYDALQHPARGGGAVQKRMPDSSAFKNPEEVNKNHYIYMLTSQFRRHDWIFQIRPL